MTIRKNFRKIKITDPSKIKLVYIDLFCGAGGTTSGVERAVDEDGNRIAVVVACVNHDPNAIESHKLNHPEVKHFPEDIRTLRIAPLREVLEMAKKKYPNAKVVLWASLECTNFSNAKGGKPKDADSRTLANHLDRYVKGLNPDYIQIENVREFLSWGDLDENGKPIERLKGRLFLRWNKRIKSYGYNEKRTFLNSADFGAVTDRNRLFITYAKFGLPINFPQTTHHKKGIDDMFDFKPKWRAVENVLDLDDMGECIFERKKPLVDNTLNRIYNGLKKETGKGDVPEKFLIEYYGSGRAIPVNRYCGTLTTKDRYGKADIIYLNDDFKTAAGKYRAENHLPEVDLEADHFLINPQWGFQFRKLNRPCFTLIARMDKAPPYLITLKTGEIAIKVNPDDSEITKRIKHFMAFYGIADIRYRMLHIHELLRIQGFGDGYELFGTKADKKKFIGNAVHPIVSKNMVLAQAKALEQNVY